MKLQLLIVGDPALATAASQLEGQWNVDTGGDFQVQQMTAEELEAAGSLSADAVIFPSCQLGTLVRRKQIISLSRKTLATYEKPWSEMFDLARLHEAAWGSEIYAVPLGSPVLTCYYRADLLKRLGRKPPGTWTEYQQVAELMADRGRLGEPEGTPWYGTIEPLGPGWAGQVLLARAAPYAKHPDHYSTLFDIQTMEPLVDGPPLVRALEELVAAARLGPPEALSYDPDAVRAAFWQGRCGLALSWPTAAAKPAGSSEKEQAPGSIQCGFAPLPGSREIYDRGEKAWGHRGREDEPHVPLLGVAGRLGAVTGASAHPEAALRLLFWLSGKQGTGPRRATTTATTLFSQSHLQDPQAWVESPLSREAAAQYAATVQQTFRCRQWLFSLRIPGRSDYLAALDEAVHQAVRGRQSPQEALRKAADQWRRITERLGAQQQRQAYRQGLQLE